MANNLENHRSHRIGWLRAAVLGANDGIVSVSCLIIGVAAARADHAGIAVAGLAGLVAGAMSMAAGEYVSVSSQADTEKADLEREKKELSDNADGELLELASIYEKRGVEPALAEKVALQLMAHDALGSHARDELGISTENRAQPILAALSSAAAFSVGAGLPFAIAMLSPFTHIVSYVSIASLICLAILGAVAAYVGGAPIVKAILRVSFWGAFAMILTAGIGHLFGTAV